MPSIPAKKAILSCSYMLLLTLNAVVYAGEFEQGMESMENGNFAEAYCIWRPLARQGHPDAAYHLGWLYANGNGLKIAVPQAVYWWTQAANQGHLDAQFALGLAYTNAEGIQEDKQKALHWYLKAAEGGHEDAREIVRDKVRASADEIRPHLRDLVSQQWLGQTIRVTAKTVNLRSGPGIGNRLVGSVAMDMSLIAIDQRKRWYQVINPDDLTYSWIAGWLTEPSLN